MGGAVDIFYRETSETQAGCRNTAISVFEQTVQPLFLPSFNSGYSCIVLMTSSGARVSESPSRLTTHAFIFSNLVIWGAFSVTLAQISAKFSLLLEFVDENKWLRQRFCILIWCQWLIKDGLFSSNDDFWSLWFNRTGSLYCRGAMVGFPSRPCVVSSVFSVELILQQIWCHAQRFNTAPRGGIFHLVKLSLHFPTSPSPPASSFDSRDHIFNAIPNIPVIQERLYCYGLGVFRVTAQRNHQISVALMNWQIHIFYLTA